MKRRLYAVIALIGFVVGILGVFANDNSLSEEIEKTYETSIKEQNTEQLFIDVSSDDWFYSYVDYLTNNGIVNGMTETEFMPSGQFTVAQAAAIITRYLDNEDTASERQNSMTALNLPGSDKWYAPYVQIMHEAGIIDVTQYGCSIDDGFVCIDNPLFLESAVKRYEFAAFVMRSFELEGTMIGSGADKNGNGSEFIHGGAYDESKLELYIPHIKDYQSIPSEYNYYVLKAYYNGIFNGDNFGNFNPLNNLTRAEMAKVVATVIDQTQRTFISTDPERTYENSYIFTEDSYIKVNGELFLKNDVSASVLYNETTGISTYYGSNGQMYFSYNQLKMLPEDYKFSVRQYRKSSNGYDEEVTVGFADNDDNYCNTFESGDKLFLILVNSTTGEAVDAYSYTLLGVDSYMVDDLRYFL